MKITKDWLPGNCNFDVVCVSYITEDYDFVEVLEKIFEGYVVDHHLPNLRDPDKGLFILCEESSSFLEECIEVGAEAVPWSQDIVYVHSTTLAQALREAE